MPAGTAPPVCRVPGTGASIRTPCEGRSVPRSVEPRTVRSWRCAARPGGACRAGTAPPGRRTVASTARCALPHSVRGPKRRTECGTSHRALVAGCGAAGRLGAGWPRAARPSGGRARRAVRASAPRARAGASHGAWNLAPGGRDAPRLGLEARAGLAPRLRAVRRSVHRSVRASALRARAGASHGAWKLAPGARDATWGGLEARAGLAPRLPAVRRSVHRSVRASAPRARPGPSHGMRNLAPGARGAARSVRRCGAGPRRRRGRPPARPGPRRTGRARTARRSSRPA